MNRSNAQHRLTDWTTLLALRRELCLPIYNTNNTLMCKCGEQYDCWGNHTFHCKLISKKIAHNIIRDSWESALQPALSTAGYIRSLSILDIEKKNINTSDITAQPFDVSFDPDPTTTDNIHTPCPYTTIGADITIKHSLPTVSLFDLLDNVIFSLTATANKHLKKFNQRKYMHSNKRDNEANIIDGDTVIGELIKSNMVLLPFAIDPHGRW
jgi:hypothetical protein